jgi:replicative DNA helicase
MIANIAKVPLHAIKNGTLSDDDWLSVARKVGTFKQSPAEIDDNPNVDSTYLRKSLDAFESKYARPPGAYFFDYLQLAEEKGYDNRQALVSAMSRRHKLTAKERGCVAVVLSQLNRGPEQRADKLPQLSDLRESGSLEQDADVVILLHRDDYYDPESPRAGELDFIVAKNRGGQTGVVTVGHQLHLSRLVSWETG